ncbi:hypothetical protein VTN96DRAFT_3662 [Rasamsonia emersonii]
MDKQGFRKKGTGKERLEEGVWTCLAEVKFGMGWDGDGVWRWCGNWEKGKSGSWPRRVESARRASDWRARAGGGMMKEDTPVYLRRRLRLEANGFAPLIVFLCPLLLLLLACVAPGENNARPDRGLVPIPSALSQPGGSLTSVWFGGPANDPSLAHAPDPLPCC